MSRKTALFVALWLVGGAFSSLMTSKSAAQIVNVSPEGGVHVRAPFVRVDVFPYDGGVSVRAPFAAVDVPGTPRYYRGPIVVERQAAQPSFFFAPQDLAAVDDATLRRMLRSAAVRLHDRLARFNTGATWQRYFRLRSDIPEGAYSDGQREELTNLLERYQVVATDPQYAMIAELPQFTVMQSLLMEALGRFGETSDAVDTRLEELPAPSNPAMRSGNRPFLQPE